MITQFIFAYYATKINSFGVPITYVYAAADFLMGIYLMLIATHDVTYRGVYNFFAYDWMTSITCQLAGVIAVVSSEVSVIILASMSVERYLTVAYPFTKPNRSIRLTILGLSLAWLAGILLAIIPPLFLKDFGGRFYGSNGVCMPLQVTIILTILVIIIMMHVIIIIIVIVIMIIMMMTTTTMMIMIVAVVV